MTNNKRIKYQRTCNNNTHDINNKRDKYRHFHGPIKLMRQSEIRGYAIRYLDDVAKNNGKCKYGFLAQLVREASTKNNSLQIYKADILNEARRIVAKQTKVTRQFSASTINNDPLHVDDQVDDLQVDDLQLTVRTNILDNAVANPQSPPLLAGGEVEDNEASVITTDDYFLYRMGETVPNTVTHVQFHSSVKCVERFSSFHQHEIFSNCKGLVKVVLNNGLEKIGQYTFDHCSSLCHIIIPSSVTSIDDWAFWNCSSLATVILNNGLQRIGKRAFNNCRSLHHIIIPPSVTTIDVEAFLGCINLETVLLHEGLQTIGTKAFSGCRSLLNIDIPTTVTAIGEHVFRGCAVTSKHVFRGCAVFPHLN